MNAARCLLAIVALLAQPGIAQTQPPRPSHWGNGLFPEHPLPGRTVDELGYQIFNEEASFSPSGIRYPLVTESSALQVVPDSKDESEAPGWAVTGALELGYLENFGDSGAADFREFADFSSGPLAGRYAITGLNRSNDDRFTLIGASPGRDDQYVRFEFSRPGAFRLGGWYNQIPHVFATDTRVLFNGIGTGELTLPDGLVPGSNSPEALRTALLAQDSGTLKLERKRGGLFARIAAMKQVDVFFNAATERRTGSRPFGGAFAYPGLGLSSETVEPIDYMTHEVDLGASYSGNQLQANLSYNGSFFINDTDNLVFENPGLSLFAPPFTVERGRIALAPDNQFHQIALDTAVALPFMQGRWTTSIAANRKNQDDDLLPPTISSGPAMIGGTEINLDLFNQTAALPRSSAEARINTVMAQSALSLQPLPKLRTTFEARLVDEDNDTRFTSFNPLTQQFGTIRLDGGIVFDDGLFTPGRAGDLIRIRNVPFATDELGFSLNTDLRLTSRTRLGAELSFEELTREHRERDKTQDRQIRVQLTDRSGPWASLRLSGEYASRVGDEYDTQNLERFFSASLDGFVPLFDTGPQPLELADLRVFDLVSRDQWVADWQLRFTPGEFSDLALSGRFETNDYRGEFGLNQLERLSTNAEWSRQFDKHGGLYVYYSLQKNDASTRGINDAGPVASDATAGGDVFPLENLWRQGLDEVNHAAGAGLTWQWRRFDFEADYVFSHARSRRRFSFASPAALAGVTAEAAGDALPRQRFIQHRFNAAVRFPINRQIGARLFYRLESEFIADPNFDGLVDPIVDNQLFLLARPEDFTAHIVGALVEIRFGIPGRPPQ